MIAKQRLYLTDNRDALVAEGDERGATLYAAPGDEIPDDAAERFGLVDGDLPKEKPLTTAQIKKAEKAEDGRVAAEKLEADKVSKAEADRVAAEKVQGGTTEKKEGQ